MNGKIDIAMICLNRGSGKLMLVYKDDRSLQTVCEPDFIEQVGINDILKECHDAFCIIFI